MTIKTQSEKPTPEKVVKHTAQSFKCCNCNRIVDGVPFKIFGHVYTFWRGGNDGTGHGRKFVAWCEECWKATEAQNQANIATRNAEIQQVVAERTAALSKAGGQL